MHARIMRDSKLAYTVCGSSCSGFGWEKKIVIKICEPFQLMLKIWYRCCRTSRNIQFYFDGLNLCTLTLHMHAWLVDHCRDKWILQTAYRIRAELHDQGVPRLFSDYSTQSKRFVNISHTNSTLTDIRIFSTTLRANQSFSWIYNCSSFKSTWPLRVVMVHGGFTDHNQRRPRRRKTSVSSPNSRFVPSSLSVSVAWSSSCPSTGPWPATCSFSDPSGFSSASCSSFSTCACTSIVVDNVDWTVRTVTETRRGTWRRYGE